MQQDTLGTTAETVGEGLFERSAGQHLIQILTHLIQLGLRFIMRDNEHIRTLI
jgi:hypothetical protein